MLYGMDVPQACGGMNSGNDEQCNDLGRAGAESEVDAAVNEGKDGHDPIRTLLTAVSSSFMGVYNFLFYFLP